MDCIGPKGCSSAAPKTDEKTGKCDNAGRFLDAPVAQPLIDHGRSPRICHAVESYRNCDDSWT